LLHGEDRAGQNVGSRRRERARKRESGRGRCERRTVPALCPTSTAGASKGRGKASDGERAPGKNAEGGKRERDRRASAWVRAATRGDTLAANWRRGEGGPGRVGGAWHSGGDVGRATAMASAHVLDAASSRVARPASTTARMPGSAGRVATSSPSAPLT
jgi:hypothetical protein